MTEFTPDKEGYDTDLTDKQKKLLSLVWECKGDTIAAAKLAGYADPYTAVDGLSAELIDMAEKALSRLSLKSVMALESVLDSNGSDTESIVIQANEKIKVCQEILGRSNPKVDKLDITTEHKGGVFVLPEKRPVDEEEEDGEQT